MNLKQIEKLCEKASLGEWDCTIFTKPDGGEIETIEDINLTMALSAVKSEYLNLYGITLAEKDRDGKCKVVAYTGNGPTSLHNAAFIAQSRTLIPSLIAKLREAIAIIKDLAYAQQVLNYKARGESFCVKCFRKISNHEVECPVGNLLSTVTDEEVPLG
jgi:hypothetical protein